MTHRYTDSPDGDWIIGPYPSDPSLFLATGGSGHAYKVRLVVRSGVDDVNVLSSSFRSLVDWSQIQCRAFLILP
jgi:hypothetical protein